MEVERTMDYSLMVAEKCLFFVWTVADTQIGRAIEAVVGTVTGMSVYAADRFFAIFLRLVGEDPNRARWVEM